MGGAPFSRWPRLAARGAGRGTGCAGERGRDNSAHCHSMGKGVTSPSGDILVTCSQLGMDLLDVLTGRRTPQPTQSLSAEEAELLADCRAATQEDLALVRRMLALAAEHGRNRA
jgi:hypothetical protein